MSRRYPEHTELWKQVSSQLASQYQQGLKDQSITINGRTMKFFQNKKGSRPSNGYSLIFGLHGGGGVAKETNDQQYQNHKHLYDPQLPDGSLWIALRSAQDASDMWRKPYMEDFLNYIINGYALNGVIDVNKVFLTGYSAGGDGTYHMAPRMADIWAGAAMMAGHPNNVDLINLRNTPFSIQVGAKDTAYQRNQLAQQYIDKLNSLNKQYGGYPQKSKVRAGKPHWMDKQETQYFPWLFSQVRNPYPDVVLFKQHPDRTKKLLYYVKVENRPKDALVQVRKNGNRFQIKSDNFPVTIYVNRKMVDFSQSVEIYHNGVKVIDQKPQVRDQVMTKSLQQRLDPQYIFDDEFTSSPGGQISSNNVKSDTSNISRFSYNNYRDSKNYNWDTNFVPQNQFSGQQIRAAQLCGMCMGALGKFQPIQAPEQLQQNKPAQKSSCQIF